MFRTRDFILLFSTITFLVMAIGTTLINQQWSSSDTTPVFTQTDSDVEYVALVATSDEISRAERVAQMRSKISQQVFITETVTEEVQDASEVAEAATSTDENITESDAILCASYRPYNGFWDARDLTLAEREGALVLSRGQIGSTSVPEVVLQLPVRTAPSGNPSCLSFDVIGIANDGSLIRNDEVGLYSIFSSDSLIGYALDGFPIYGGGSGVTDTCGGLQAAGTYRYQVQSGSETIINCFASTPVGLP